LIGSKVEFRTSTLPFIATPHEKRKRRRLRPAQMIGPCALAKFDWLSMVCTARALTSGHD
jgi:hypothetical protein